MKFSLEEALKRGIAAHNAGRLQEAEKLYRTILRVNPNHPDANHNLGILSVSVGSDQQALLFLKNAIDANPSVEQYWVSYVNTLINLGRAEEVPRIIKKAVKKGVNRKVLQKISQRKLPTRAPRKSDIMPTQHQLQAIRELVNRKKLQQALIETQQLLMQFPESVDLCNWQGVIQISVGNVDHAIDSFKQVIRLDPNDAGAHNNMANALREKGVLNLAITSYKNALKIRPNYSEAHRNMGLALQEQGYLGDAIDCYQRALEINPNCADTATNICDACEQVLFDQPNYSLLKILSALLRKKTASNAKSIAKVCLNLLKSGDPLNAILERHAAEKFEEVILDTVNKLAKTPELTHLMSMIPLTDLEIESVLTDIRALTLSSHNEILGVLDTTEGLIFYSALASQCFLNEYIYSQTREETLALIELERIMVEGLNDGSQPHPLTLACLASYKALHDYAWCNLITIPKSLTELAKRQIWDIEKEQQLKLEIPVFGKITNKISSTVQEQYEKNPYPRWHTLGLPLKRRSVSKYMLDLSLRVENIASFEDLAPDILVAGCGTGQHSIVSSSIFENCKVLAVDLSLSSLAYAKRKSDELGLANIEYMQADILNLSALDKTFDVIECGGVLHHMDDPMEGWQVLTRLLKPGGLMKIGLYSELARQHIVTTRAEITQAGWTADSQGMRLLRDGVISSDQEHHKKIIKSSDFYSMSELRDLLFHVQEHRFSLPQISDCLDQLGLTFCGFENHSIVSRFKSHFLEHNAIYDINQWHDFEEKYPDTFVSMYQFWCQKTP